MKRSLTKSSRFTSLKLPTEVAYFLFFLLAIIFVIIAALSTHNFKIYAQENDNQAYFPNKDLYLNNRERSNVKTHPLNGKPVIVSIVYKDSAKQFITYSQTVDAILDELKIDHTGYKTEPALDSLIKYPYEVQMIQLGNTFTVETQNIPYDTKYVDNTEMQIGTESVIQKGVDGTVTTTWQNLYEDGILTQKVVFKKEVNPQPVTQVIERGTKVTNTSVKSCEVWGIVIDNITTDENKRAWMKSVMKCESKCDAGVVSGRYYGLYQFLPSTFISKGGTDILNGEQQIQIVSKLYDQGQQKQWPGCNNQYNKSVGL